MLKLKLQYFAHLIQTSDSLTRPWWLERLRAREGNDRGWDGWMASRIQWTWVWVNSRSWWWTWKPGVLQSMWSQSWTWLSDWSENWDMTTRPWDPSENMITRPQLWAELRTRSFKAQFPTDRLWRLGCKGRARVSKVTLSLPRMYFSLPDATVTLHT